jgi:hypothetical protein
MCKECLNKLCIPCLDTLVKEAQESTACIASAARRYFGLGEELAMDEITRSALSDVSWWEWLLVWILVIATFWLYFH